MYAGVCFVVSGQPASVSTPSNAWLIETFGQDASQANVQGGLKPPQQSLFSPPIGQMSGTNQQQTSQQQFSSQVYLRQTPDFMFLNVRRGLTLKTTFLFIYLLATSLVSKFTATQSKLNNYYSVIDTKFVNEGKCMRNVNGLSLN